jgi:FdhD protein
MMPSPPPASSKQRVDVIRANGTDRAPALDWAAVEEPLEIRLHDTPFAVIMRTPGADIELAAGFLFSERVISSADDLGTIAHCRDRSANDDSQVLAENIVNVTLTDDSRLGALLAGRRQVTTNSSCGLCGRRSIESLASCVPKLSSSWPMSAATLSQLADRLRATQTVFDETGGLHAAGLFSPTGTLLDSAEDIGRHNAVDKVVGRALMRDALPLADVVLFVSGRSSFEIVQKALFAGISLIGSVSAPSSLAISLADEMGITLAGFVRGERLNLYTHTGRIRA